MSAFREKLALLIILGLFSIGKGYGAADTLKDISSEGAPSPAKSLASLEAPLSDEERRERGDSYLRSLRIAIREDSNPERTVGAQRFVRTEPVKTQKSVGKGLKYDEIAYQQPSPPYGVFTIHIKPPEQEMSWIFNRDFGEAVIAFCKRYYNFEDAKDVEASIYALSYEFEDDLLALKVAQEHSQKGNPPTSIAGAVLLMHRAKEGRLGAVILRAVFEKYKDPTHFYHKYGLQALDFLWRMIHHHPALGIGTPQDALEIVLELRALTPSYASPELGILYDLGLKDFHKAVEEYRKALQSIRLMPSHRQDTLWLNTLRGIYFLLGSLQAKDSPADLWLENEYIKLFSSEYEQEISPKLGQEFSREVFLSEIQERIRFFNQLRTTTISLEEISRYILSSPKYVQKTLPIWVADFLAPSQPELALEIYKQSAALTGSKRLKYAVGDFQVEPTRNDFPKYTLQDWLPF